MKMKREESIEKRLRAGKRDLGFKGGFDECDGDYFTFSHEI